MKVINISKVSEEVVLAKKTSKRNNVADSTLRDVDAYKHKKETRKNAVPVGLASYDTSKPKPKKYEYDPQPLSRMRTELVWEGNYDEYGNRREVDIAGCAMPMQKIETIDAKPYFYLLKSTSYA